MIPNKVFFAVSIGFVIAVFTALKTDVAVDLILLKIEVTLDFIELKIDVAELRIPWKFPRKPDAIAFQIEDRNEPMLVQIDLIVFQIAVHPAFTIFMEV